MTLENMLRTLRNYITEVDPATSLYQDDALAVLLGDATTKLKAKKVFALNTVTFDDATGTFPEDPADGAALIIVLQAAVDLLRRELRGRLKRGEFGVSWRSGLEEESSVTAAKSYESMVGSLDDELQLILITQGPEAGTRPQ